MIRRVWRRMSALSANMAASRPLPEKCSLPSALHCPACTHVSTLGLAGAHACMSEPM